MKDQPTYRISTRKQPRQARSTELVAAVLEAAAHVLAEEGAPRFTTARVAERAGVSVGSLYQYFPNKAAILFRLQSDEWAQTTAMWQRILGDTRTAPLERLRTLVDVFLRSECEESQMRGALNDAAPLYRDAPEAREARASVEHAMHAFMQETLPHASEATRTLAMDLVTSTLGAVGEHFSRTPRTSADIDTYAMALADMLCAYLTELDRR